MKKFAAFIISAVLMTGCSPGQSTPDPSAASGKEQQEQSKKKPPFTNVQLAETAEDLASQPPGELTKDFTEEQETKLWAGREVPEEIQSVFIEKMKEVLETTEDASEIHQALVYYLGNAQYGSLVEPLLLFTPEFDEPLLPEPHEIHQDGQQQKAPTNAVILLDASSSMLLQADGHLKMETAKSAVRSFGAAMGQNSAISLYAYGHMGSQNKSDQQLSCSTIDEVYPLGEYDEERFRKAVAKVEAKGWTPLAGAIAKAREDHAGTTKDITLYIVSDGEETCGGDPIAEAEKFAASNPDRHVNVIGFQVDSKAESQLQAVAEAGNGTYMGADTLEEMTGQMTKLWLPSDLDIATLVFQSPVGWPQATASKTILEADLKITRAISLEHSRLLGAVSLMQSEELIEEETADEVTALINQQSEQYQQIIDTLVEEKRSFVEEEVHRISKKIEDYHERMTELKQQNQ